MVLKRIGLILEGIAVLILGVKYFFFWLAGDFGTEATTKFITDILTFGVQESIPLEVTLIQIFGVLGVVVIVADLIIFRGN
jgi:hypothetical protein